MSPRQISLSCHQPRWGVSGESVSKSRSDVLTLPDARKSPFQLNRKHVACPLPAREISLLSQYALIEIAYEACLLVNLGSLVREQTDLRERGSYCLVWKEDPQDGTRPVAEKGMTLGLRESATHLQNLLKLISFVVNKCNSLDLLRESQLRLCLCQRCESWRTSRATRGLAWCKINVPGASVFNAAQRKTRPKGDVRSQ